ncbi:uncharacterized protein LOC122973207 isoform X2 [Scomber scombrus]|uniref:Uncharacterized protein LOC122973207 isoform X2 n=1 Tax=Scomber scombrus TaxID=13677 RepID=A0AAV1QMV2_SCOSC
MLTDGAVDTKTMQKDPVTAVKKDASSTLIEAATSVTTASTAAAAKEQPTYTTTVTHLTVGDMAEKHLLKNRINCLSRKTCFSPRVGLLKSLCMN